MKKRLAYLIACSVAMSQIPVISVASPITTANLEVTLNLNSPVTDYAQMDLKMSVLSEDNKEIVTVPITEDTSQVFKGLQLGTYKVRLTGKGYKTYISKPIELLKTEKHVVIDAGSSTFAIGDINQDATVDENDLKVLEGKLGSSDLNYDLNGDQLVDIEDLARLYWSKSVKGEEKQYNTKIILDQALDVAEVATAIADINAGRVNIKGEVASLFDGNDTTTVALNSDVPITEQTPVKIPINFHEAMSISEVILTAPEQMAPTAGYVVYEDEAGNTIRQPFSDVTTEISSYTRTANKVVKINLGRQVPVQKLTIEVTNTNSATGLLAAISKIEFLEDVVEHAVNQEQSIIKGFTGTALDEGVRLKWNQTANTTGYKIQYGTAPSVYSEVKYTKTNSIELMGLENEVPYYFVVQAINGDWEGPVSKEITVTPTPQKKPSTPREVNISSFDKALKISCRIGDDAISTNVYYKKVTDAEYTKIENVSRNTMIRNLENDTEYMVYVTAVNHTGESAPSEVVKATPKQEELIIPEIPTVGRIDKSHITSLELLDPYNVNEKYYPEGFDVNHLIDEDYTTHWTAKTYQRNRGFRVTFDQPYEMDYVAFVPRMDSDLDRYEGTRKYWHYPQYYTIKVWETLDSAPKTLITRGTIPSIGENGLKILPFEKTRVAKMEVYLYEWDGAGNMSISEVMFYEYGDIIERINNLFADGTFTTLKQGVTLEQVEVLIKELDQLEGAVLWTDKAILKQELLEAKALLTTGTMSNLGKIVEVVQDRQLSTATSQNFAADGLSNLQATGTMAYAQQQIIVYVDAPEGGTMPELVVSQFYGDDTWQQSIPLVQGRNVIEVPKVVHYNIEKGGPLYVTYTGSPQDTTTVRIVNAKSIPTLELASLKDEEAVKLAITDYVAELTSYVTTLDLSNKTKNPANSTEIGTDKILLSLPAEEIYRGITEGIEDNPKAQVERLYETLMTWEENIKLHYTILGLEENGDNASNSYPKTRFNVRYMPMNNGVFMYAAGNHIGIQYHSGAGLVKGSRDAQTGYFGWGINHEIGHIINDENFVFAETSNNIFALFAQTVNGGNSRLEDSDVYTRIYEKVVSKDTGLASDVFINLGMLWQLHLAYDTHNQGAALDDFYPKLHRLSRKLDFQGLDAQNYFIRVACAAAEKDLTPFFERWGLHITKETYDFASSYTKETRALYYLNDEAMRYRLNGGQGMVSDATASITAITKQLDDTLGLKEQEVCLQLESTIDEEAFLGYEIYKDGELIAFTTEDTYVDKVSANNITHTYSVVAYDKLLNTTEKANADEVYIGAEGTLDASEYSMTRTTTGAIQIELSEIPEVVGLKLKDITVEGNYTVEVSSDGNNWATAKASQFETGTTLVYFNKPGMSAEDDRIWTYDAKYIRISGDEIEHLQEGQIEVLGYPGDAVYFTEGAIGYLASDYAFESSLLKAGTLVVMGSYRGHPVYSKIVLSAKYVDEKDYDQNERPGYSNQNTVSAVPGELYMFAEVPEDGEVSKVSNGIWLFVPETQQLPSEIKANMFRTDEANTVAGGRLVSDTKWLVVPHTDNMPSIELE